MYVSHVVTSFCVAVVRAVVLIGIYFFTKVALKWWKRPLGGRPLGHPAKL